MKNFYKMPDAISVNYMLLVHRFIWQKSQKFGRDGASIRASGGELGETSSKTAQQFVRTTNQGNGKIESVGCGIVGIDSVNNGLRKAFARKNDANSSSCSSVSAVETKPRVTLRQSRTGCPNGLDSFGIQSSGAARSSGLPGGHDGNA